MVRPDFCACGDVAWIGVPTDQEMSIVDVYVMLYDIISLFYKQHVFFLGKTGCNPTHQTVDPNR